MSQELQNPTPYRKVSHESHRKSSLLNVAGDDTVGFVAFSSSVSLLSLVIEVSTGNIFRIKQVSYPHFDCCFVFQLNEK